MPIDLSVQYYVIGDISSDNCPENPREDGEWTRIRVKEGVKFGYCTMYDGAAPSDAYDEAENVWALCNLEDKCPDDVTFMDTHLPTRAVNRLIKGELEGIIVGQEWVIIPADMFPFDDSDSDDE